TINCKDGGLRCRKFYVEDSNRSTYFSINNPYGDEISIKIIPATKLTTRRTTNEQWLSINLDSNSISRDTSSKRYKSNIQKIDENLLDEVFNINVKTFDDTEGNSSIGLIAEQIFIDCPNLRDYLLCYVDVNKLSKNQQDKVEHKYKILRNGKIMTCDSVDYRLIGVLLLEIVKKQQQEIDKLKNQINNLIETNKE